MDEPNQHDEEFNPTGTVWLLALYVLLIVALWGWAYVEMLSGA